MISNNYRAMEFIRRIRTERLTPGIVCELHRILTTEALDDPTAAGRLRRADETIHVVDEIGRTLHIPPDASELADRMARLCEFANATSGEPFIHPVVRAILLHLWLAYDHPFVDGNGRTARALFYWSMASQGYWLCEYISISRILRQAPGNYVRAFLYTETDDNDATYFVLNQLRVTVRAIHDLHEFLRRKAEQLRETRRAIEASSDLNSTLNHRQLALVNHAIRNPRFNYTIESHRRSHNISYQTARTDLLALAELGLLDRGKAGKAFVFLAPPDLRARVRGLGTDAPDGRPGS
jgi:Fic family protein